ncbi:MAG: HNH endonuclease [Muribaculaceae bacterium]
MEKEQMTAIYKMAIAIYNKKERLVDGKKKLFLSYGINKNSFADFYRALQKMLNGELHTRGISTDLRDYYLSQIFKDYGADKLRVALKAYMDFIIYYENGHNNRKRKIERDIHKKYCDILNEAHSNRTIENEINAYWEGELGQVTITTHSRNIDARNKCIQSKGIKCYVCGFDFEKTYGELGKGFIHVHHINPISNTNEQYEINIEKDLFPVCPNCHAMLHRKKESTLSLEELKEIIQKNNV